MFLRCLKIFKHIDELFIIMTNNQTRLVRTISNLLAEFNSCLYTRVIKSLFKIKDEV